MKNRDSLVLHLSKDSGVVANATCGIGLRCAIETYRGQLGDKVRIQIVSMELDTDWFTMSLDESMCDALDRVAMEMETNHDV